ncbi:MAG TPA: DNA mismatch repair protein [Puia sp.]|jgi:DNA mismatch repair ATPase MutS|nr:DNA mismatch repair protein [Puia sp.]
MKMPFAIDQQTMDDLNIFGRDAGASVYAMFNHTFTRGGAELMESMFRYPLSDADAINTRSGMIRYFSAHPSFPFDTEFFDVAEQYLANTDERSKLSHGGEGIAYKFNNLIAADSGYKFVYAGVMAMLTIVRDLREFTAALASAAAYQPELSVIVGLLADPALAALPEPNKTRLPYATVSWLDTQLRFRNREKLHLLLQYIYRLDVYISVGRIAVKRGFVFPEAMAGENNSLELEGIYHPQLTDPVPNDLRLTARGNLVFLTGANQAGKSTFMRSLGTAMYLAHMGFPVAASRMAFSVRDGMYTTINLPDDLGTGVSHFYAEVLRVKKVARELGMRKNLFVIFDELFRGTNVKDAYEATIAITAGFAQKRNSLFVISTHIVEAGEVLKDRAENIRFIYLPTTLDKNTPVYSYRLEEGITADRHGMVIIRNEGIIELLKKGKPGTR